jgi:hypothetical protein
MINPGHLIRAGIPLSITGLGFVFRLHVVSLRDWEDIAPILVCIAAVAGVGLGTIFPKKSAPLRRFIWVISIAAVVAASSLIAYNAIIASPPTENNYFIYTNGCLILYTIFYVSFSMLIVQLLRQIKRETTNQPSESPTDREVAGPSGTPAKVRKRRKQQGPQQSGNDAKPGADESRDESNQQNGSQP